MHAFLESEYAPLPPDKALFHVIPVPYEASVSYGSGTANGPDAILAASFQLEAFNGRNCPGEAGIFTAPPVDCGGPPESVLARISSAVSQTARASKIPVILGGEHTVTLGAVQAFIKHSMPFGVVQFDAHADLRQSYEDSPFSHACVMRRICERTIPIFQIGVRALSLPEHELRKSQHIPFLDARDIAVNSIPDIILPLDFPELIYISFDIDAFDPSLMPATGTPEPGGLLWHQALNLIENISTGKRIIGFDVVELAPIPQLHSCDYTAARLVYELMGFCLQSPHNCH